MVQTLTYRCPHCNEPVKVAPNAGSEVMVCPHKYCGKPFQVAVPTAEPVTPLVLVGEGAATPSPSGAGGEPHLIEPAAPVAETAATAHAADEVLAKTHPVMFRRFPLRFLGYGLLGVIGVAGLIMSVVESSRWLAFLSLIVAGYGLARLGLWWLKARNTTLTVTDKRCILRTGILKSESAEVLRTEVAEVEVNQDLINRLLNVGDIVLRRRGQEPTQVVIKAMPAPEALAAQIRAGHR